MFVKVVLLTVIIAAVVLFGAAASHAQLYGTSGLVLLNAGYTVANTDRANNQTGAAFLASYEKLSYRSTNSLGFGLSLLTVQSETDSTADDLISSIPMTIFGKVIFGPRWVKMYAGGGLGIHLSYLKSGDPNGQRNYESGFVLTFPFGVYMSLSETVLINFGYTINWMSTAFFDAGVTHVFSIGIGFQLLD